MNYSDQLLYNFKHGDAEAFRELFDEFYPRLCSFACKYLKDDQASEDVVQEVLSDIWDRRKTIIIKISVKSFLYTSVKNRCLNRINKDLNEKKRLLDYVTYASDSVEEYNYIEEEVHANLYKAIKNLPEKSQEVILLSMREMSNVEIQEELNVSVNTVKSNKRRAYKMLREMLR